MLFKISRHFGFVLICESSLLYVNKTQKISPFLSTLCCKMGPF